MDKREAKAILADEFRKYRERSYGELQELLDRTDAFEVTGGSGTSYQLEFYAVWDDKAGGNLRVLGYIDDGGWRAYFPLGDCFIIAPDGSFVGE